MGIASKKADKEKRIVEAATKLFATNGYQNTTIEGIAKEAKIAKGTVYLYFKDKQQLFCHIIKELSDQQQRNQAKIHEYKEWKDRLYQYVRLQLLFFEKNVYLARISLKEIYGMDKDAAELVFKAMDRHVELLTAIIRGGVKDGVFNPVDEQKAALAFMGMVNYYIVHEFLEKEERNIEETATFLLTLFLNGLSDRHLTS